MEITEYIEKKPRAVLVSADTGEFDAELSMKELEELANTAGVEVAATVTQKRPSYDTATCIGSGRLEELAEERDSAKEKYDTLVHCIEVLIAQYYQRYIKQDDLIPTLEKMLREAANFE